MDRAWFFNIIITFVLCCSLVQSSAFSAEDRRSGGGGRSSGKASIQITPSLSVVDYLYKETGKSNYGTRLLAGTLSITRYSSGTGFDLEAHVLASFFTLTSNQTGVTLSMLRANASGGYGFGGRGTRISAMAGVYFASNTNSGNFGYTPLTTPQYGFNFKTSLNSSQQLHLAVRAILLKKPIFSLKVGDVGYSFGLNWTYGLAKGKRLVVGLNWIQLKWIPAESYLINESTKVVNFGLGF